MDLKNYHTVIGDPVDELKTTVLWKRLNDLNPTRASDACEFVRLIDPVLKSISLHFPLYTRHDCHHGYEVIERMGDVVKTYLLSEEVNSFTDDEIFCLIISAYAHDVGMAFYEDDIGKKRILDELGLRYDIDSDNQKLCSYLRDHHAERGLEYLRTSDASKCIPDYIKGLIGVIMKGHNMTPKALMSELPEEAAIGRGPSDPRALSIILCCADAIEFSDTRVIDIAYQEALNREDEAAQKSLIEMRKHRSIGSGLAISNEGFIIASGDFDDSQVLHATHSTLDQVECWMKEYIIYNNRLKRPVLRITNHTIIRDAFTLNGFSYFPIAIKIDEYQIKELLTSQRLWGNEPGVPIRELVQNAVETCRYRNHISPISLNYQPQVELIIDYANREITIVDNGCGMDVNDVTEYFLQIGKSKSRDPKFKADKKNTGFDSIARFGVGFWSVFSIADFVIVSTHALDEPRGIKFNVSLHPVMRYLEIRSDISIPLGTQIKLKLKSESDISRLLEDVTRYVLVAAVPIVIKDHNLKLIHAFDNSLKESKLEDVFEYRSNHAKDNGIKWFHNEIDDNDIEFRLGIAYSKINDNYRCLLPDGNSIFNLVPPGKGFIEDTSVCGFKTKMDIGPIPFAISRVGVVKVNIKTPKDLIYSFNRLGLEENDRYQDLKGRIMNYISMSLDKFYNELNVKGSAELVSMLISDSRSNGGEAGDSRIPELYNAYNKYFNRMVPITLLHWERNGRISSKTIFIDEFWKIDKPVSYVSIWPSVHTDANVVSYIHSIANKCSDNDGYVFLASHEASAIIDAAKTARVKTTNIDYLDWNHKKNQYIEIIPRDGFDLDDKHMMKISAKWTGDVSKLDFARVKANKPWLSFGRYRMFVDVEHDLIKELIRLYNEGFIWQAANLLSLMMAEGSSDIKELEKLTGIKANY